MSAEQGSYDRSVIMLRVENDHQKQAYEKEITKLFYLRAAEESLLVSKVQGASNIQIDPRIASFKQASSFQLTCLLYFYEKKTFTKTKVVGAKYAEAEFEIKEGGCMTSKITKIVPSPATPLVLETFGNLVQKQVLWEGKYKYRLLFMNDKLTQLCGVYSDEEYDLLKLIANQELKKAHQITTDPRHQSLVHFVKSELPSTLALAKAELLYQALLDLLSTAEFFIDKQNKYDSIISDHEAGFTDSRVPTTPGLQRRTTIGLADSSLEGDSVVMAGSEAHFQNSKLPKQSVLKVQSEFGIQNSTARAQQEDLLQFSKAKPSKLYSKDPGISNYPEVLDQPNDFNYASMIKNAGIPEVKDNEVLFPGSQSLAPSKLSVAPTRSQVPNQSKTYTSNFQDAEPPKPEFHRMQKPNLKKAQHPFTLESQEPALKSELISKQQPSHLQPNQSRLSPRYQTSQFVKKPSPNDLKPDATSKLIGDPYANGVPTAGSELNFKSKLSHQQTNYFQGNTDAARAAFHPAQSGSDLQSKLLLDFRHQVSEVDTKQDQNTKKSVSFNSMCLPASIDHRSLVLLLFCRGITRNKVPGLDSETIKVKSNLLKKIAFEDNCKAVLPEFDHFVVPINQKLSIDSYSTEMDFFEVLLASKDEKTVYGSLTLTKEFLEKIDADKVAFSVPMVLEELEARKLGLSQGKSTMLDAGTSKPLVVFVNLLPGDLAESAQRDKKVKLLSQQACRVYKSVTEQANTVVHLNRALSSSIKQRKTDELSFLLQTSLPPNVMLMLWLLVTKKFKPAKQSTISGPASQTLGLCDPMEKLKSAIIQSMYSTKKELGQLELNNRVSVYFHRLLRTLDKQGLLCNPIPYYCLNQTIGSLTSEYFKSSINRYKLMEFIFTRIMADYFDMYLSDQLQQTHLSSTVVGPAKRNALLTRGFRGCSRDHLLLHIYINTYCEKTAKAVNLSSKDFVIWIVDHILSVNIGVLKEQFGTQHLNFLFSQSIQHKDDLTSQFGWLINLMLHVFLLDRVEKLLTDRLTFYTEKSASITPELLYNMVLNGSGLVYQEFIESYLAFEKGLRERRLKNQQQSMIGNFFTSLAKSTTEALNRPGMESMWSIYEDCMKNSDLQRMQLKTQQENITVFQLCRLDMKPNKVLNLLKSEKKEQTRRIVVRIHGVLNKDYPQDQFLFHALCDTQEPETITKAGHTDLGQEATFVFTHTSSYSPILQLQVQVLGDELLYRHNTMIVGSKNLQLRRFQPNTVHNILAEVFSEPRKKVYFLKTTILIQEVTKDPSSQQAQDREGIPDGLRGKYLGQLGFLMMDNFKHPIGNFENLIQKNLHHMFDELGMEIQDCYRGGRFRSTCVRGYHLHAHPDGKTLKLSEEELRGELDTFLTSLKVLLFKNQFEMLEDYVVRYFGSDQNSLTAAEVVYLLQSIFKVLGVRTHLLEVVAYVESVIKRSISPKIESFSLILGADQPINWSSGAPIKTKIVELKRSAIELVSHMSIRHNSGIIVYGDKKNLFLIKDIVEKMRLESHLTNVNYLQIKHQIDGGKIVLSETIQFNKNFAPCVVQSHPESSQKDYPSNLVTLDDLLESQQYFATMAPSESLRVSKSELRRLLAQLPLVEYVRFCVQSLKV